MSLNLLKAKLLPCDFIDSLCVVEHISFFEHSGHVLFVVKKGNDKLPNTERHDSDSQMQKFHKKHFTKYRNKPAEK